MNDRLDQSGAAFPCKASLAYEDALEILSQEARPLGPEVLALDLAAGRRLAEPVIAGIDGPRWDCAAMDGYAVRNSDLKAGVRRFSKLGPVVAGDPVPGSIGERSAMRVMTGAPLPPDADRVIMIELCRENSETVEIAVPTGKPHVRRRGSDFQSGQRLLDIGRELTPAALVAAAAGDNSHVAVWRQARMHIVATGDELVPPGKAANTSDRIPDSLSAAIRQMSCQWGSAQVRCTRTGDDPAAIRRAFSEEDDLTVIVGGASRGDRDFARAALIPCGLRLFFADVAMKPGKPSWYGKAGRSHILGLPGNPTAALTVARLFLAPLLVGLGGGEPRSALLWKDQRVARDIVSQGDREAFLIGDVVDGAAFPLERQEASAQHLLGQATILIRRPAHAAASPQGSLVPVLPL